MYVCMAECWYSNLRNRTYFIGIIFKIIPRFANALNSGYKSHRLTIIG